MTQAVHQLPSERLARRHIPTAEQPLVDAPGHCIPDFPRVGTLWRGADGLAVVEAVSENDVVDYSWRGVTLSLSLSDFFAEFPTETRI